MPEPRARPVPPPAIEPLAALGGLLDEWRERLVASGLDGALLGAAERVAPAQLDAVRLPLVEWWLERRGGPGAALARLLCYGCAVPAAEAREALGDRVADALREAGVLVEGDGGLRARLRVTPLEGLHLVSDPFDAGPEAAMGPGATTMALVRAMPAGAASVLDLGCGAGTLALLAAARGARRAVGVDLNGRAVALARLNARLNRLPADFLAGDLVEPVRGERFELAVAQPPYVVRPPGVAATTYLHGGEAGDELALRFAGALAGALRDGGRALLHYDAPAGGEPVHVRLRRALGDAPVDLAVLSAPGPGADLQAVAYASLEHPSLGEGYGAAVRRYRDHLEARGGRGARRVLAVLVHGGEQGGRLTVELPVPSLAGVDAAVLDRWLAGVALAAAPEAALLAAAVAPWPGARLREERPPGGDASTWALHLDGPGLAAGHELGEAGAALVDALAGGGAVADAVARFAEACGEPPEAVRARAVGFVREGLGRGLLAPAGPGGAAQGASARPTSW